MKRRYMHRVIALGADPSCVADNVSRLREQGLTLLSTYVDPKGNPAVRDEFRDGPIVMGVFESWEKVRR